jgi:hypothetical protein
LTAALILKVWLDTHLFVITGLVPVIPIKKSAALHGIGMAGTSPAMTGRR